MGNGIGYRFTPALTLEQWARQSVRVGQIRFVRNGPGDLRVVSDAGEELARLDTEACHALAGLALENLRKTVAVGFSWDDVDFLINALQVVYQAEKVADPMSLIGMNYDVYFFRLAERVAGLLPPRGDAPTADYEPAPRSALYEPLATLQGFPQPHSRRTREHFHGCLLGGAVGDALGAPVEFMRLEEIRGRFGNGGVQEPTSAYGRIGAITDDTQMALFTAEGLLRAEVRMNHKGICHMPSVVHHAYIRWLHTQGETSDHHFSASEFDGWLFGLQAIHERRAPGNTCLSALRSGRMGSLDEPINDSKGCGTVMRIAPMGLVPETDAFRWGMEIAAITHGHRTGILASGFLAQLIYRIIQGDGLRPALARSLLLLRQQEGSEECVSALLRAYEAAAPATAETVEQLGAGWVAEEAVAIAVFCALKFPEDFASAVRLAVNHSGDSDSTGAITGNIMGALLGVDAIPAPWVQNLELRREIEAVADDMLTWFRDDDEWWERYPGW